jgi:hypothetical protein
MACHRPKAGLLVRGYAKGGDAENVKFIGIAA